MIDYCPRCGRPRMDLALGESCPQCATAIGEGTLVDLGKSRAFGSTSMTRLQDWKSIPRILLPGSEVDEDATIVVQPSSTEMPAHADRTTRVQLLGEIARGGMGAVLKGRDPDLGRDLAVKVLLEAHRDNPDLVRRFVEEAQIGGQLQHPGIVPVYELGTFGDSRPYFTMKLVKGRTLSELLADRVATADDQSRFLAMFLQVAQTVAYAHARGVIHRDLKPSNVMVGSFGEVQVMDWGLAKVLARGGVVDDARAGREPPTEETVIATARSGSESDLGYSQAGSVLGTPSYMAPEQARGEIDRIDRRADVFALGSILAEILTGRPAFVGRGAAEIVRKAARGELAEAFVRLDASKNDADLVALARECLAPEVEDRPADAQVLADRLLEHLNSIHQRLRDAEIDRATEHARAEEAKRTATAEAARAEAAEARSRAERRARRLQLGLAASLIGLMATGGGGYAWTLRQQTERSARTARTVDEALADADRLRSEARSATSGDLSSWTAALASARRAADALEQSGDPNSTLHDRVALVLARIDRERADAEQQARQRSADRQLMAALESIRGNLVEHDDRKRTDDDYAAAFVKAGIDLDRSGTAEAGRWLEARSGSIELASFLDDWADVRRSSGRPEADWRRLIEVAAIADPDPWRRSLRDKIGTNAPAALDEFRRLADDGQALDGQSAVGLVLLARQLRTVAGDRDRASRVLRRSATLHPGDFWTQFELAKVNGIAIGNAREMYPRPEESVRHLTAALAIRPESDIARSALGFALQSQGKTEEAIDQFRQEILARPANDNAYNNLGYALDDLGRLDEAVDAYQAAIQINPRNDKAYNNLGFVQSHQGRLVEAVGAYRAAIRINPNNDAAHNGLGVALKDQGQLDEAIAEHRSAIQINPANSGAHNNLAMVFNAQGKPDEAIAELRAAIRINPANDRVRNNLGAIFKSQGNLDDAIAEYWEAIRINPGNEMAHCNLGITLLDQGKLGMAVDEFRQAIQIRPGYAEAHHHLGGALRQQGDYVGSLASHRRAHDLGSRQPGWSYPSADWVHQAEVLVALANRIPALLDGSESPIDHVERLACAQICYEQGRHAAAARLWSDALNHDPRLADDRSIQHRYNAACSATLAGSGIGKDDPMPDVPARAKLRQQALDWLGAELATWTRILESGTPAEQARIAPTLTHWQKDSDLAGIRDSEPLAKQSASEQEAWRDFWGRVDALLKKSGATPR